MDIKTQAEISPRELKSRLDSGEKLVILDVREPHELKICSLVNTVHIPMGELPDRLAELDKYKGEDIIVYCRSGGRSGRCVEYMRLHGFDRAINLTGGILLWSDEIDQSMSKY